MRLGRRGIRKKDRGERVETGKCAREWKMRPITVSKQDCRRYQCLPSLQVKKWDMEGNNRKEISI